MKLTTERLLTGVLATATITLFTTPAAAVETPQTTKLEPAATTSQSLAGVTARNSSEWLKAVGGQYADGEETEPNYEVRTSDEGLLNSNSIEIKTRSQDWENANSGDFQRGFVRLKVTQF